MAYNCECLRTTPVMPADHQISTHMESCCHIRSGVAAIVWRPEPLTQVPAAIHQLFVGSP
jgi:hypothetical protein